MLFTGHEWTTETLEDIYKALSVINDEELKLDIYPNEFQIINYEQMLDAYTSVGMPINYKHWSFGKQFIEEHEAYKTHGSLAYELVINVNPTINYLMEENSATLQALVQAHAAFGHNSFFKTNYLFKEWTDASSIIDYLEFAKNYIKKCEETYGHEEVERIIDSCHALKNQGIDRYKKPYKSKLKADVYHDDILWKEHQISKATLEEPFEPVENVLKYIEKKSIILESWQREIIRIVRKIAQYLYPQMMTKVMNEGFACWTHCYMMNRLYDKKLISESSMFEFITVHSNVVKQPDYNSKYFNGFNPYSLGLAIFNDIERICKTPTDEDREWFPEFAGNQNHIEYIKYVVANFRDESFIRQFLSPKVMRDFRLFSLSSSSDKDYYKVQDIHNDQGFRRIRKSLADSYDVNRSIPNIQIVESNLASSRTLELVHYSVDEKSLYRPYATECCKHIKTLWGYTVKLKSISQDGTVLDEVVV